MPYYQVETVPNFMIIGTPTPSVSIFNAGSIGAILNYWYEPFGPYDQQRLTNILKIQGLIYEAGPTVSKLYLTSVSSSSTIVTKWVLANNFSQANQYAVNSSPFEVSNCSSITFYGYVTFL